MGNKLNRRLNINLIKYYNHQVWPIHISTTTTDFTHKCY